MLSCPPPTPHPALQAVCHCTVGYRSGQFAQQLLQAGGEAYNLRGGILGYVSTVLYCLLNPCLACSCRRTSYVPCPDGHPPPQNTIPPPFQTHAGLPLVEPATGAPTKRVHVFAPRWAMHGDGYTPVAFQQPLLE